MVLIIIRVRKRITLNASIDFLGIGAPRTATTWVWENLHQHPNVWLPPIKELHYFDRSLVYPSPSYLASSRLRDRLFGREAHNRKFREHFIRKIGASILRADSSALRWNLLYHLGTYNDEWYLSLFANGKGKVRGEITPAYSILNLEDVKHIRELFPDLKVLFTMRNPIERAWSSLRYSSMRGAFNGMDDFDKMKEYIESPGHSLRGDYVRTLEIWGSCFPQENIFIGFYDDVVRNPQKLLFDLFDFLNLEKLPLLDEKNLEKKVNTSTEMKMPAEVHQYLAQKYYPEMEKLSKIVDGWPAIWLKEAEAMLTSANP